MWRPAHLRDEWLPRSTRQALAPPEPQPHLRGRVSRTVDGHALLAATWRSLAFRKDIRADGSFHALMEQGRDRLLWMPGVFYHDSRPHIVQLSIGLTRTLSGRVRASRAPGPLERVVGRRHGILSSPDRSQETKRENQYAADPQ